MIECKVETCHAEVARNGCCNWHAYMVDESQPVGEGQSAYVVAFESQACTACFVGPTVATEAFYALAVDLMRRVAAEVAALDIDSALRKTGPLFYERMEQHGYRCPDPIVTIRIREEVERAKQRYRGGDYD